MNSTTTTVNKKELDMSESHSGERAESLPTAPSDKHLPSSISLNFAQTILLLHMQKTQKTTPNPQSVLGQTRRPPCSRGGRHANTFF